MARRGRIGGVAIGMIRAASRIRYVLAALLVATLLVPQAGAVVKDERRVVVFDSMDHATIEMSGTFSGDEARQLRLFMDTDSDGNVSLAEAQQGEEDMRLAANDHDTPPFATLDGGDPVNRTFTAIRLDGIVGPSEATTPFWANRTLDMRFAPNGAEATHTLVFQVDEPGRLAAWHFTAPSGFEISDVRGLRVTSQDAQSVDGFPEARSITLSMTSTAAQAPTPTPTGNSTDDTANGTPEESAGPGGFDIPAPGILFLVAGLLGGAFSMRRRDA